jgi:hypothetical protein
MDDDYEFPTCHVICRIENEGLHSQVMPDEVEESTCHMS